MGPIGPAFAAGFGALAALLLIGGGVLIRWQRNRLQFSLMQAAIERGTPLPLSIPLWLVSFRQGVMIFVLGMGLFLVGGIVHQAAEKVPMPTAAELSQNRALPRGREMDDDQLPPPPMMRQGGDDRRPGPPPRREEGPPRRDEVPAVEQWHRAQDQKALGSLALASGFVLVLLGVVRVIFAFTERRYTTSIANV